MGERSAPDLEIPHCDVRSTAEVARESQRRLRGDRDGGGVATVPRGRWIPRRIYVTHGGWLSLLRSVEGARVVGDGGGGRGSGSGGSHCC